VLYEGKPVGTPDAGAFWRVIAEYGVSVMFTAPTAFRAIKREDPKGEFIGRYDLSKLRALFLAGERCDPDTLGWATEKAGHAGDRPLVADRDRLADRRQLPRHRAVAGQARLADAGRARLRRARARRRRQGGAPGDIGSIMIRLPLPPGACPRCGATTSATSTPT
jgi:propionyl-CoA synthetase